MHGVNRRHVEFDEDSNQVYYFQPWIHLQALTLEDDQDDSSGSDEEWTAH